MVSKIAIGLAAAAIAMVGATSGTLAQNPPGVGNQPPGVGDPLPPRVGNQPPGRPQGNARDEVEPRQRGVRGEVEPRLRRSERDRGADEADFGQRGERRSERDRGRGETEPRLRSERDRGGVNINLGGMAREREGFREERGRGGSRINLHLGHLGGHPGYGPSFNRGIVVHHGVPSFHRGFVEHRYSLGGPSFRRGRPSYGQGQNVKIKIGGEKARGEKRGGVTLHVR
jgi:hypothetical protein